METNIFHYCKMCKKNAIITEVNIYNRLGRDNVFMKNGDLKIFEINSEPENNENANYFIKNKKIFCKNCNAEIGYLSKPYGVISINAIDSRNISFQKSTEKNKIKIYFKHDVEFQILSKKIKILLETLKNFLREFYTTYYVPLVQHYEEIKNKKNTLYNIINNKDLLYLC
jgi:hypothetical protein